MPDPPRRTPAKTSERLRRMLVVVPYLIQHPGTAVAEAAGMFDLTEEELLDDLGLLFVSGLPPYGPGDLVDVDIQEGRIWISMADYFSRPLRLTRSEALALFLRGTSLSATPGVPEAPALASALAKLADGLGPETLGELPDRVAAAATREPESLAILRDAVEGRERVRIEYHAASSAETSTREIDPEVVFSAIGHWYVAAWDAGADAERLFRVDRIRSTERTGERFSPRGLEGAGRSLYTPTERDVDVRLRLAPAARWVAEYYETVGDVQRDDGTLEIVVPAARLEWLERLALRLGRDLEIVDPPELRGRVRDLAAATLARYR
ncbi:MAG TPA: WYL domain-containing protein [Actinomycetota bacterium]|nr:WYL domain-containing protein [Actinomycetota bacterium]